MRIITTGYSPWKHKTTSPILLKQFSVNSSSKKKSRNRWKFNQLKWFLCPQDMAKCFVCLLNSVCSHWHRQQQQQPEKLLPEASFAWTDVLIIQCACVCKFCRRSLFFQQAAIQYSIRVGNESTQCKHIFSKNFANSSSNNSFELWIKFAGILQGQIITEIFHARICEFVNRSVCKVFEGMFT